MTRSSARGRLPPTRQGGEVARRQCGEAVARERRPAGRPAAPRSEAAPATRCLMIRGTDTLFFLSY